MTVPVAGVGRKQRFKAALALAGITMAVWASEHGITLTHLNYVLVGERKSESLTAAIDEFITLHLPGA